MSKITHNDCNSLSAFSKNWNQWPQQWKSFPQRRKQFEVPQTKGALWKLQSLGHWTHRAAPLLRVRYLIFWKRSTVLQCRDGLVCHQVFYFFKYIKKHFMLGAITLNKANDWGDVKISKIEEKNKHLPLKSCKRCLLLWKSLHVFALYSSACPWAEYMCFWRAGK